VIAATSLLHQAWSAPYIDNDPESASRLHGHHGGAACFWKRTPRVRR